jgi:hypothetical protein
MNSRYLLKAYRSNGEPVYFRREAGGPTAGTFTTAIGEALDFGSQAAVVGVIPKIRPVWRGLNTFTVAIDSAN